MPAFFMVCIFSIMPRCKSLNYHFQLLMYLQKWWWILSMKINQLPKVASPRFLLSHFLAPFAAAMSTPFPLHLISLQHLNLPRPLCLHPDLRSLALSRSRCPNVLSTPSFEPSFLPSTPRFFSPPLPPLPLHPSDWVMAIRAGTHPAAVWDRHWSHAQSLWAEGMAIHFVHGLIQLAAHCNF